MPWNLPTGHGVQETGGGSCASADDEGHLSTSDVFEEYWPAGQPLHSGHDGRGRKYPWSQLYSTAGPWTLFGLFLVMLDMLMLMLTGV
jgi:hypothetical protein